MTDIFKILQDNKLFSEEISKNFEEEIIKNPFEFIKKIVGDNSEMEGIKEQLEKLSKELNEINQRKNFQQSINLFEKLKKQESVSDEEKKRYSKLGERGIKKEMEQQEFCFIHNEQCNHIIDSHSIQENGELSIIAKNKQVISFQRKEGKNEKEAILIPITKASTFRGFCHYHDQIFEPLDKSKIKSEEQRNYLYSFRTFAYSYYTKKAESNFILGQVSNAKIVIDQIIPKLDTLSTLLGINLTQSLSQQGELDINSEERQILDKICFEAEKKQLIESLSAKHYNELKYFEIDLDYLCPFVFASILEFERSSDGRIILNLKPSNSHNCAPLLLTIVPIETKTRIILTVFAKDNYATKILEWFKFVYRGNKLTIETFTTKLILHNYKNLFLSPDYWFSLPQELKEKIISFINGDSMVDLGNFNLFEYQETNKS